MKTKDLYAYPFSGGIKLGVCLNAQAISRNLEKLKNTTTQNKSRNPTAQGNTATYNSTPIRVRSTSRIPSKDATHEKMLQRELNIFRREAEIRYKNSTVNTTYKFPKYTNDPSDLGLTRDDVEQLKRDPLALVKCTTSGVPEPIEEKPSTLKTLKSMKSIYLTQRGPSNGDLFLYGSLKKMVNRHIKVMSGRASPVTKKDKANGMKELNILGSKNSNDSTDSKYSYRNPRIRNTPLLKSTNIKNAILQKILSTMPNTKKADSKDSSNLQGSSININALTTSISAMKSFSTEKNKSMRAGMCKDMMSNPLMITRCIKNKKMKTLLV